MRYRELANIEPQIGDVLAIELGDVLVEATIQDLREDGVVIELDRRAVQILSEAERGSPRRLPGFGDPATIVGQPDPDDETEYYRAQTRDIARRLAGRSGVQGNLFALDPDDNGEYYRQVGYTPVDPGSRAFAKIPQDLEKVTPIRPGIKIEPPVQPEPEKAPAPAGIDFGMEECENALDWGIKTVRNFSNDLKSKLRNATEGTTLEYLVRLARREKAFEKNNFTEKQLRACQVYLGYKVDDSEIETWDDLISKPANETQNVGTSEKMKYDEYLRRAHDIQARFQEAVRSGNKELAAKIEQEREELDAQARRGLIPEAEYRGRKVALGKPMKGDVKKSKVYVRGPKGNVVKVNFGDPNMKIKKSNPKRRKSFRARHNCANPGPRWKARYWSCRAW